MKSTVKTQTGQIMCMPVGGNGVLIATSSGLNLHSATIATPEQVAALVFSLGQCLEKLEARRARDGATRCGQVSNGITCDFPRVGIEKLCPDCNPWRPISGGETVAGFAP